MSDWNSYYKKTNPKDIPWNVHNSRNLDMLWEKYDLAHKGNILDVGCGPGAKSIYLAEKGFNVWGIDISSIAINLAIQASENLPNPPDWIVGNIAYDLKNNSKLKGIRFDVILDIVSSQFLIDEEKYAYLTGLKDYSLPGHTFLIFLCFADDFSSNTPEWVKKVAMSPETVTRIYGTTFDIISRERKINSRNMAVDRYVMEAKS